MTAAMTTWRRCSPRTAPGRPRSASATGRAAIAELARGIRARAGADRPRAAHLVTNIAIVLDGEHAEVRSNWMVMQNSPQGPKIGSGGGYADNIVRQNGHWLFHHRKIDRFIAG